MFLLIIFNVNKPESLENSVVFLSKKSQIRSHENIF